MRNGKEGQFKGVKITIIGVVLIIIGLWLREQVIVTTQPVEIGGITLEVPKYISLNPYGWILIAIGATVLILGIWKWTSTIV